MIHKLNFNIFSTFIQINMTETIIILKGYGVDGATIGMTDKGLFSYGSVMEERVFFLGRGHLNLEMGGYVVWGWVCGGLGPNKGWRGVIF